MKSKSALLAVLAGLAFSVQAACAEIDRAALFKHLPKALPFPPGFEFDLKDVKPSTLPGFLTGRLEGRYKGQTRSWTIQITQDGRYYILSDAYALAPSKVPGLLSAQASPNDSGAPQVHVAKDAGHFLFGEMQDLTVDPDEMNRSKIRLEGAPFRGEATAPVALVEYSDLECPFCRGAHLALDKELLAAYGKKVRWIFKHNPLVGVHPWSYAAAVAAACAARLDPEAGWKLEAGFFAQQDKTTLMNVREKSLELARQAGLDKSRFETCFDKQQSKDAVQADMREAKALGLDSTPVFVVNGRIVRGFRDFETLKAVIDEMLAEQTGKK